MFSNNILQFIIFINNLSEETYQKIIIFTQFLVITLDIICFFYIRHITREY